MTTYNFTIEIPCASDAEAEAIFEDAIHALVDFDPTAVCFERVKDNE